MSYYRKDPCSKCGKIGYLIRRLGLIDNNSYFSERECRSCHHIYKVTLPLVLEEDGNYTIIQDTRRNTRLLQHLVWEWVNETSLPLGTVIHHLNGKKRDNRPQNLEAMPVGGHSGFFNTQHKIQYYKKRIRELERELCQLKSGEKS